MKNIDKVIEKRNAQWEKASRQERRIMIAQDVLSVLRMPAVSIEKGTYCELDEASDIEGRDLQEVFTEGQVECTACGKGSMLLSAIRYGLSNSSVGSDLMSHSVGSNNTEDALVDVFTADELDKIEAVFEQEVMDSGWSYHKLQKVIGYFSDSPRTRLHQMMKRIIACDGDVEKALTTDPKELVCNPKQKLKELLKEKS